MCVINDLYWLLRVFLSLFSSPSFCLEDGLDTNYPCPSSELFSFIYAVCLPAKLFIVDILFYMGALKVDRFHD